MIRFAEPRALRSKAVSVAVFLITAFLSMLFSFYLEQEDVRVRRAEVSEIGSKYAEMTAQHVERSLSITYAIAALIRQRGGIPPNFQIMAADLLQFYPGASAVALLPDGIISDVVPPSTRDGVIGRNLLTDPRYSRELPQARDNKTLSLVGPFLLVSGGTGFTGTLPVFLDVPEEQPKIWGFTTVSIQVPRLIELAGLRELLEAGIDYEVWRIHPDTGAKQIIDSSSSLPLLDPVNRSISLPNVTWTLSVAPRNGWGLSTNFIISLGLGLLFSCLFAYLAQLFIELRVNKRKLERTAYFDPLTNLPNRRLLLERLDDTLVAASSSGKMVAICYLDLDGFKPVNDSLGHEAGDFVLVEVARRCEATVRTGDVVSRIGGDEFIIVLQDIQGNEGCQLILDRLLLAISAPIPFGGKQIEVTASIGVALYPHDGITADELIVHSDLAMYAAKKAGEGRYQPFADLTDASLAI